MELVDHREVQLTGTEAFETFLHNFGMIIAQSIIITCSPIIYTLDTRFIRRKITLIRILPL